MRGNTDRSMVERLRAHAADGRISRRELLREAAALGIAASAVSTVLAGCQAAAPARPAQGGPAQAPAGSPAAAPAAGPRPARNQTIVYPDASDVRSTDPADASETQSIMVLRAAYEGLVAPVPGKAAVEPRLATEWKVSDDARTYTFSIRQGVKFHDGTMLDATAVKKTFDRTIQMNRTTAAPLAGVDQIRVVDNFTVQFSLKEPNAYFAENLSQVGIISPTAWEKNDKDGDMGNAWLQQNSAGTGSYRLTEMRRNEQHSMEKFDDYWRGWSGNHLTKIVIPIVPEIQTRRQMLEKGQAHIVRAMPADDIKALKANPTMTVQYTRPSYLFYTMPMNMTKPPLDDVRVRRAIQYAFDYKTFLEQVWLGQGTIANGPTAEGWPGYDPGLPPMKLDLEQARKLLAEAGAVEGTTLEAIYLENNAEELQSVVVLQDSLKKLGINLKATAMPWATMFKLASNADTAPHLTNLIILPTRPDPTFTFEWSFGCAFVGKPYNWSYYCNDQVQKLIDQARSATDRAKGAELLEQANKLVVDDAPVLWYGQPDRVDTFSAKLQNFSPIVIGYPNEVDWYPMWLAE